MTPGDIETRFSVLVQDHTNLNNDLVAESRKISEWSISRDEARGRIKSIEAMLWANGGTHDHPIDGKNEKLREAQHQVACDNTRDWVQATTALRAAQVAIEGAERNHADISRAIRRTELEMQLRIEQFQFLNTPRFYRDTTGK